MLLHACCEACWRLAGQYQFDHAVPCCGMTQLQVTRSVWQELA